ncbi:helix-turn-helix transcriptional regulator [Amycolatopsis sp. H6(2020)]|nr:helix-turn-helix transcriptional regulator [Amycolatopsis sp. H6(2020)]
MAAKREGLARARRAAGYTQEDLARALLVDVSTVGNWEAGRTEPLPHKRALLARLLDIGKDRLEALLAESASDVRGFDEMREGSPEEMRQRVERVRRDYDWAPSVSLLAIAARNHQQLASLRASAQSRHSRRDFIVLEAESAILLGKLIWDASQRVEHYTPRKYFERAIDAARYADDRVTEARAWLRTSYLSLYGDRIPRQGLHHAQRAADVAGGISPVHAGLALLHVAEAEAMLGSASACDRTLDAARAQLGAVADGAHDVEVDRMAGSCHLFLGRPRQAEEILLPVSRALNAKQKSKAIVLGNLALAQILQRDLEAAVATLHRSLDTLEASRGGGGLRVAIDAARQLRRWRLDPRVMEVQDRLLALMTTSLRTE